MKRLSVSLVSLLTVVLLVISFGCASPAAPVPAPAPTPSAAPKATPTPTPTHAMEVLELRAGDFAASTYKTAVAIETTVSELKHPWLRVSTLETIGGKENVTTLCDKLSADKKRKSLTGVGESNVIPAIQGVKPYTRSYKGEILGVFYASGSLNWMATLDPTIKTPNDLIGKRIGFWEVTSSLSVVMTTMLKDVWQITDKVKTQYMDRASAAAALIDGRVDVIGAAGYFVGGKYRPSAGQEDLFANRKVYAVSIPKTDWQALAKVQNTTLGAIEIPKGTLGSHQTEPFTANLVRSNCYWAHRDTDPALVYELVKIVADNGPALVQRVGVETAPERQNLGQLNIPEADFHPGAIKFYKENGIKVGTE